MRRFSRLLQWLTDLGLFRRGGGSRAYGRARTNRRSGGLGRSGLSGLPGLLKPPAALAALGQGLRGLFTRRRRTGRGPGISSRPRPVPRRIDERASRRAFGIACAFLAVSFVLWALFAPGGGVLSYFRAQGEVAEMRQKSADLVRENAELRDEIDRLKTDEAYLEKVARGKYGLLKKDERVYDFTPKNKKDK